MDIMVEPELHHVVEVLPAFVLVDITAPDVTFTREVYLAVDSGFPSVLVLLTVNDAVKAMVPAFLALLRHEQLGDCDVQRLLFPSAGQLVLFLHHMIVFIGFMFYRAMLTPHSVNYLWCESVFQILVRTHDCFFLLRLFLTVLVSFRIPLAKERNMSFR